MFFSLTINSYGEASIKDSLINQLENSDELNKIKILEELSELSDISLGRRVEYLVQAVDMAEEVNNPLAKANALYLLGQKYQQIGDFSTALKVSLESLTIYDGNKKDFESGNLLSLIGAIYFYLEDFEMSLKHLEKALEIRRKIGDDLQISHALSNVGNVMGVTGKFDEAMEYYQKALKIRLKLNDLKGASQLYNNIANVHFAKGEIDEVLPYRLKALEMDRERGDRWEIALKTYNLAEYYLTINQADKALPYINESKSIAESLEDYGLINDNIQFLSLYYEQKNDFPNALKYQKEYAKATKETFSKEMSQRLGEMQVKYETEVKEKENVEIKSRLASAHYSQLVFAFIMVVFFLIASFALFLFYKKKKDSQVLEKVVLSRTVELEKKNKELEITSSELMIAKENAEESNRLKSAFLANMSHEIRTPMNGILGFMDLLKKSNLDNEERIRYIDIVNKSGDRLLSTISMIIEISKIESGDVNLNYEQVEVLELLEYYQEFFLPSARAKGLEISLIGNPEASNLKVVSDKNKLGSILSNLIANAIKYTNKGLVEFGCNIKNGSLVFFVRDTGIGIDNENLQLIFKMFRQAMMVDSNVNEGNGLGLSISKHYVEMLKGEMWVESELNIGSVFYFSIPLDEHIPHLGQSNESIVSNSEIPELKILIAEDDQASLDFLKTILVKSSKEILIAKTGKEAVRLSLENPDLDLILMDIRMPEVNGYKAVKEIREVNKEVVIIAQTAYAIQGDKEKLLGVGCNDYISKPIRKEALLRLLNMHFKDNFHN